MDFSVEQIESRRIYVRNYIYSFLHGNAIHKYGENISQHSLDSCVSATTKLEGFMYTYDPKYMSMSHDDIESRIKKIHMNYQKVNLAQAAPSLDILSRTPSQTLMIEVVDNAIEFESMVDLLTYLSTNPVTDLLSFSPSAVATDSHKSKLSRPPLPEAKKSSGSGLRKQPSTRKGHIDRIGSPKARLPVEHKSLTGETSRFGRVIKQTKEIPADMLDPNISARSVLPSFDPDGFRK